MANILGLIDPNIRTIDMFDSLVNKFGLKSHISVEVRSDIQESLINDHYKKIDPLLEPFVGVYDVEEFNLPSWWEEFKTDYIKYLSENVKDEIADDYAGNKELDETKKMIQIIKQLNTVTVEHLRESKLPNGHRVVKALKKIIEICCTKGLIVEDSTWYKTYESKKLVINDLKLIITNSAPSQIGMSSYFENPSYTSCQTFYKSDYAKTYCKGIWSNLLDTSSLIMYITKEDKSCKFYGTEGKWNHQTMIARYMLRLITVQDYYYRCKNCGIGYAEKPDKCSNCGSSTVKMGQTQRTGVVIDRSYPHAEYSPAVFKIIKEICDDNNLELFYMKDYKISQGREEAIKGVEFDSDDIFVSQTKNYVGYTKLYAYDKTCEQCDYSVQPCNTCSPVFGRDGDVCTTCVVRGVTDARICQRCSRRNTDCLTRDCLTCPQSRITCKDRKEMYKGYYDDHAGGGSYNANNSQSDNGYKNQYEVHIVTEVL